MPIIIEGFFALLSNVLLFTSRLDSGNSFPHPLSPEKEKYYLERARQGDKDARDILIRHNLRLVVFIAKKYNNYPDQDELISVGTLGLMKAIKTYSEGKGTQLATYASRCIENEILMTMRSRKKLQSNVSLYENIGSDKDGNQLALIDVLCEDEESVYQNLENRLLRENLVRLMKKYLTDRERTVLTLRFGLLTSGVALTQQEVADRLKISRSYVSRIEKASLRKMKEGIVKERLEL